MVVLYILFDYKGHRSRPFYVVVDSAFIWGVNGEQMPNVDYLHPSCTSFLPSTHNARGLKQFAGATGTCPWQSQTQSTDLFASPQTLSCFDTTDHLSPLQALPEPLPPASLTQGLLCVAPLSWDPDGPLRSFLLSFTFKVMTPTSTSTQAHLEGGGGEKTSQTLAAQLI